MRVYVLQDPDGTVVAVSARLQGAAMRMAPYPADAQNKMTISDHYVWDLDDDG